MDTESQSPAQIVTDLYNAGLEAYERRELDHAQNYLSRCLAAFLQGNTPYQSIRDYRLLALILFGLGRAIAYRYRSPETAVACCEASANLQKFIGRGEAETDRVYMAATVISILEDYATARRLFQIALDRYRQMGNDPKANMVHNDLREMKERLGESRYRHIAGQTTPMNPHQFVIHRGDTPVHELTITRDGIATHQAICTLALLPQAELDGEIWWISHQRG